uniref:Uncharacterized protein n=1 Tax=Arundo donax TaxID=35708 RepID=A0A0A9AQY2_ARUDO
MGCCNLKEVRALVVFYEPQLCDK